MKKIKKPKFQLAVPGELFSENETDVVEAISFIMMQFYIDPDTGDLNERHINAANLACFAVEQMTNWPTDKISALGVKAFDDFAHHVKALASEGFDFNVRTDFQHIMNCFPPSNHKTNQLKI